MVFYITFMLALFYDKKCCNCINLFSCILWDLIVIGLVLSWWRLLETVDLATWLGTQHSQKAMWGAHVEVQESAYLMSNSQLVLLARWLARCTDNWDFKCDSYTLYTYYIYSHYPHKIVKMLFTTPTLLERATHLQERNSYNLFSSPLPSHCCTLRGDLYPKHNSHLFRV